MKTRYHVLNVGNADELSKWLNMWGFDGFVIERVETLGNAMIVIMSKTEPE